MKIDIPGNIKALIFDVDGTLADSMPVHFRMWNIIGQKYGFYYSPEEFEQNAGMSGQGVVRYMNDKYGLNLDPDNVAYEKEAAYLENLGMIKPVKPVVEILERHSGNLHIAAGTGGFREMATKTLKFIGVWDKIETLVCADDVKHHKPAPDTFLQCARNLGINPPDCMVFEDSVLGFQAAVNAGMKYVDVRPLYYNDRMIK